MGSRPAVHNLSDQDWPPATRNPEARRPCESVANRAPVIGNPNWWRRPPALASHRIASHRIASHRIASHHIYHDSIKYIRWFLDFSAQESPLLDVRPHGWGCPNSRSWTAVRWAAGEGTAYAGVSKSVCVSSDGQPSFLTREALPRGRTLSIKSTRCSRQPWWVNSTRNAGGSSGGPQASAKASPVRGGPIRKGGFGSRGGAPMGLGGRADRTARAARRDVPDLARRGAGSTRPGRPGRSVSGGISLRTGRSGYPSR
jgi:hypothetical protein